jgi:hypothetical protein
VLENCLKLPKKKSWLMRSDYLSQSLNHQSYRKKKMSDDNTESSLQVWGKWLREGNNTGLGMPACTLQKMIVYGQPIRSTGGERITPTDEVAERVEKLVCRLSLSRPNAARALRAYYQDVHATLPMVAKRLRIGIASLKRYLEQGRIYVMAALDEGVT